MPMTLSEFLIDLAYDVGKLQAYLYDRENYVQSADLSDTDKARLVSRDPVTINTALASEDVDAVIRDDGGGHIKLTKKLDSGTAKKSGSKVTKQR